jgi:hypothetical protein
MEQIKINIPEGKVPVMEQTEKGVVITWKEKELTYEAIELDYESDYDNIIEDLVYDGKGISNITNKFYTKVEVLRKLTNIRNYFGKPDPKEVLSVGWCISVNLSVTSAMPAGFGNVVFLKKEHAEQAIKMLGDELKYLFEPW